MIKMTNTGNGAKVHIEARDNMGEITGIRDRAYDANRYLIEGNWNGDVEPHGIMKIKVNLEARDSKGNITGSYENPYDLGCKALAQFIQNNILDTAETIKDVSNSSRVLSANSANTAPYIVGGITGTAATFADYALGDGTTHTDYKSNSSYAQAATINAVTSNTFTVTATISNTSGNAITYAEVGMACTSATYQFLLAHDTFTGLLVSNNGSLAVTYTLTFT